MASQNDTGYHSLTTSAALSAFTRVTVDAETGYISAAGANTKCIGVVIADAASGDVATVKGLPSRLVKANGAITLGSQLFPAASGLVTGISTSLQLLGFNAKQAAAASGDVIELIPVLPATYLA